MTGRRLTALLAFGIAALGIAGSSTPAQATLPGPSGRIAFWDFMTRQIYAVNPDGTGLVQLTNVAEGQTAADPASTQLT